MEFEKYIKELLIRDPRLYRAFMFLLLRGDVYVAYLRNVALTEEYGWYPYISNNLGEIVNHAFDWSRDQEVRWYNFARKWAEIVK